MRERAKKSYFKNESIYTTISGKEIELSKEMYNEFLENKFLVTLNNQAFNKNHMYAIYADKGGHLTHKKDTDTL
jgi:hypothetical protein